MRAFFCLFLSLRVQLNETKEWLHATTSVAAGKKTGFAGLPPALRAARTADVAHRDAEEGSARANIPQLQAHRLGLRPGVRPPWRSMRVSSAQRRCGSTKVIASDTAEVPWGLFRARGAYASGAMARPAQTGRLAGSLPAQVE